MSDAKCPHCEHEFDYDGETEGFWQDSEQEFDCPRCEKNFFATVYWDLVITDESKEKSE